MQIRIRAKRHSQSIGPSRRSKGAGFVIGGLVLLLISSCSFFNSSSNLSGESLVQNLGGICLTGSGKGRIEFEGGRHLFNYESLLRKKQTSWALGLSLPLIGQEILELSIPAKLGGKYFVTGTFAKRLKNDIKSRRDRILLEKFFQRLSEFVGVVSHKNIPGAKKLGWVFFHDGEDLFGEVSISKKYVFKFKAFSFSSSEHFYQRIGLSIASGRGDRAARKAQGFNKDYIQLQLFISNCHL